MNSTAKADLSEYAPETNSRTLSFDVFLSSLLIGFSALVSIGISFCGLLIYIEYAAQNRIVLERGCEGPGVPFAMLSGLIFALILRFR